MTSDPECAAWENIDEYYDKTQFVTATCNGTVGTITSRCDMTYIAPACESLTDSSASDEGSTVTSSGCYMVTYDSTTTTCSCPITTSTTTTSRRRLSSDNSSSAVEVNYVALAESVVENFVDTWVSTKDLNTDVVEDGWQVSATMTAMIFIIIVTLFSVHKLDGDRQERSRNWRTKYLSSSRRAVRPDINSGSSKTGPELSWLSQEEEKVVEAKQEDCRRLGCA